MVLQFKSILHLLETFPNEQACIDHLELLIWNGNPVSPFDESSKVYKCAGNKYKCKNTGKYFNIRTGTIFDNTKIPLQKWFLSLYIFSSHKKGISSHQLAKDIDVTQKSAWFMLHRLRYAFQHPAFTEALGGIVEIDETFVGGETKNKHENKIERKPRTGHAISTKTPVVGMMERDGNVVAQAIPTTMAKDLLPVVRENVAPMAILMTDSYPAYKGLDNEYFHEAVNHKANEYVRGMVHTNGIECFWSHMQRGLIGIYHHVSVKHLNSYVQEFSLRYNTRKTATCDRFDVVLTNTANRRLTYNTLTNHA